MNVDEVFPSKWLRAEDIVDKGEIPVTIENSKKEIVGEEEKLVLYFHGIKKGLVMNLTNALVLKKQYGKETENWKDKNVVLFTIKTQYKKEIVDAIRIKIPNEDVKAFL